ncbi:MAG: threonine-phosphate decarboxylase CobD [Bacillota bacterium]|nr:threonine-phosphate decarboxylase CobD [Bacillota bacterium]
METYEHGADIYTTAKKLGIDENLIIDFSSNINPLGIPQGIKEAYCNSLELCEEYPDQHYRKLIEALSENEKVPNDFIFPSNGASESIFRIVQTINPKEALITSPTFGEYEEALDSVHSNINYYPLKEGTNFKVNKDFLDHITEKIDIIFLCNPNNPTGVVVDKSLLEMILNKCLTTSTYFVLDESFIDFLYDSKNYSLVNKINLNKYLIILKSFTKIFAMPGIRLGYCISSDANLISKLKKNGPPWNISTTSEKCGIAAVKEKQYIEKSVKYIISQRNYLIKELEKLELKVFPSKGNYILFKFKGKFDLKKSLEKEGILIRSCYNYKGLDNHYYRIAVKKEFDNNILIDKLKKIIK